MDYERKLKLAKEALASGSYDKDTIEYIFPELKESEDEKVRKAIHIYLDWLDGRKDYAPKGEYSIKDMIAWLEKKGESYTKKDVDNAFVEGMAFAKNELEKQCEQKDFAPKVEPKFKVSDWVINKLGDAWHIDSFDKKYYQVSDGKGNYNHFPISTQDEMRPWTIEDAKKGDVLVYKGSIKNSNRIKYEKICLFNNLNNAFFTLIKVSNYVEECNINVNIDYPDNTIPATKEQCDLLFKKMHEAGYE